MDAFELTDLGVSAAAGRRRLARGALLLVALTADAFVSDAGAQMPGSNSYNRSLAVWNRMDVCKRQAWKQHPDYTPDGNAKRDRAVKQCLEANNLPPTAPLTPQPPAASSGSSR